MDGLKLIKRIAEFFHTKEKFYLFYSVDHKFYLHLVNGNLILKEGKKGAYKFSQDEIDHLKEKYSFELKQLKQISIYAN